MNTRILSLFTLLIISCALQAQQNIYISSRNTNAIKRFDLNGNFLGDFVKPGEGGLNRPQDLLFHPKTGHLLVTAINNGGIKEYDPQTGAYLGHFSSGYFLDKPTKMRIGPDSLIYVSQWGVTQNKVVRFDLNGNFVDEFTSNGVPDGMGVDWDANGNLYVSTFGGGSGGLVYSFDSNGNSTGTFINSTILEGPVGIWKNASSHWFVVDWTLGSVFRFDDQGNYLDTFITGFTRLEGHAFDAAGNIYLCDWQDNKVNRYLPDGTFDTVFISGGLGSPNSILFGPAPSNVSLKEEDKASIDIFPNPFVDEINIIHPELLNREARLEVHDIEGKIILTVYPARDSLTDSNELVLNTDSLPVGTYLYQLWVEEQLIFSSKAVKKK